MNEMNSKLIPVFESTINEESVQTVNARELHAFLESKQDFSTWIKARIKQFEFTENSDYVVIAMAPQKNGALESTTYAQERIEYHVSLDMAKELAMVERNAKGKEARQYFISIEKAYKLQHISLTPAELILRQAQMLVNQERRLAEMDDRVKRIECKQQAFEDGIRYFTVIGYVGYKGLPAVNMTQAQKIGKIAKKLSNERSISVDRVKDQRHGYVGSYHETVLDDAYATLLETFD